MNIVGYYGLLQPFSDALKLILKETIIPSHSNKVLFFLAPISTLVFSLLGWAVIPFGKGLAISDLSLGVLYSLALSSLGVIGLLFSVCAPQNLAFKQNKDYKIKIITVASYPTEAAEKKVWVKSSAEIILLILILLLIQY